jgi:osmoprotectant transport system permease protein
MNGAPAWRGVARLLPALLLVASVLLMPLATPFFHALFPALERPVYVRASFLELTLAHLGLVAAATIPVVIAGIGAAIFVTRRAGSEFAGILDTITAIGQTFPPAAVLALAVPLVGYGAPPTVLALVAYGILPVVDNTIAGLRGVSPGALDAARGMGFTPRQRLLWVELPLAAPVILAGVRTSTIISVGTAAIGSTVGALSLGSPIIEGLSGNNTAYVVQGAIVVGLLAVTIDQLFALADEWVRRSL